MKPLAIDFKKELEQIQDYWSPRTVAKFNDSKILLAKCLGEFHWHDHESDEFFQVISGELTIRFEDGELTLKTGQSTIVPAKKRHQSYAEKEAHILFIEQIDTDPRGDTVYFQEV